jgi:hypothetical protein
MTSNIDDQRNWLERLGERVPGYSGYLDKERRRDIDKLHREHLANRLRAIKAPLTELMRELTSSGRLFEVGPLDRMIKKLDKAENRLRFASYGYSGFFDTVKIQQSQLESIYQFDLALVDQVDKLEAKAGELKSRSALPEGLKAAAAELEELIDQLDRTFDQRYQAINRFGQDQPPSFHEASR